MPDKLIPNTDHVTRYCGFTKCVDGDPQGAAFMLRPNEGLSVNWLESTGKVDRNDQIAKVREHLIAKGRALAPRALFAVLHLQTTVDHVRKESPDSRVLYARHEPELPEDPSHSGIYGYSELDDMIADLIAQTVIEIHPAKSS